MTWYDKETGNQVSRADIVEEFERHLGRTLTAEEFQMLLIQLENEEGNQNET